MDADPDNELKIDNDFTYSVTPAPLPSGVTFNSGSQQFNFFIGTEIDADDTITIELTATGKTESTAVAKKSFKVTFKCRCLDFEAPVLPLVSHVFGQDASVRTLAPPDCKLRTSCQRPDATQLRFTTVSIPSAY